MLPVLRDWGRALYKGICTCKGRSINSAGQLLTECGWSSPFQKQQGF